MYKNVAGQTFKQLLTTRTNPGTSDTEEQHLKTQRESAEAFVCP